MALDRTILPDFIEIDPQADLELLKSKYESITETSLSPAQFENIFLAIMVYYMSLTKLKFNKGARLNLPQFSQYPIIDFIGELFQCPRLTKKYGYSTLKINIKSAFNKDLTIVKGLEILTKDEKYIFTTEEDTVVKAGELSTTVKIKSNIACADVNNYGAGDITILLRPFDYIESVVNIEKVSGGADDEEDAPYIERIIESAEGFSCAGSKGAYKYFTKSAHPDIIDCLAKCEQKPASIKYNGNTYTETAGRISSDEVNAEIDYFRGKLAIRLTIGDTIIPITITIPPAATVSIYPLTKTGELSEVIKKAVESTLSDETVRPMTDVVEVLEPQPVPITRKLTVYLSDDADKDSIVILIGSVLENYKSELKSKLGKNFVLSQLVSQIGALAGVYKVEPDSYSDVDIADNEFIVADLEVEIK